MPRGRAETRDGIDRNSLAASAGFNSTSCYLLIVSGNAAKDYALAAEPRSVRQ
jgi:hypothetical protein